MKPVRFFLNLIFGVSVAFIIAFFVFLSGGGRLLEMIAGEGTRRPALRFLAAAMPVAVIGTLAETITRPQDNKARLRKTIVTLVMAGLFAFGAWLLNGLG